MKNDSDLPGPEITLKPFQYDFVFSEERFPALIAGIGTGKTYMLLLKIWNFLSNHPNCLGLICRKEYTDLHDSTMKDFTRYFGVTADSNKEFKFPNGSVLMFRHAAEVEVLKNINLSIFGIEQAEEFETDEQFIFLRDRLRNPNAGIVEFFVGFFGSIRISDLPLKITMVGSFECTNAIPVSPLGISINIHLDYTIADSFADFSMC